MVPTIFGLVSEQYSPLQNSAAFEFFDPIVGKDAAIYHTPGRYLTGNGFNIAKLPGCIRVVGDDITDKYLLLSNSHDGRSAIRITFTPIRVVCNNTLTQALSMGQEYPCNPYKVNVGTAETSRGAVAHHQYKL